MKITSVGVHNYKSFHAPDALSLGSGFNVVTGQNSAGKTALLEILSLQFSAKPHRTLTTVPTPLSMPDPVSSVDVTLELTNAELVDLMRMSGRRELYLPAPDADSDVGRRLGIRGWNDGSYRALVDWFCALDNYTFELTYHSGGGSEVTPRRFPTYGVYSPARRGSGDYLFATFRMEPTGFIHYGSRVDHPQVDIGVQIADLFRSRIYRFPAERMNVARYPFGHSRELSPNAANLPEVLNTLQANLAKFRTFKGLIREVLPQVRWVSVQPIDQNNEILVWSVDPDSGRDDLAVSLADSGTGISQALAILYVVVNSAFPRVVLIDEPQSYLHPGAAVKLIQVLRRYPQHQFVIATHSPAIITAAEQTTIAILKERDGVTQIEALSTLQAGDLRSALAELGASLADVFGADNILWVEGPTEAEAFPVIIETIMNRSLMGTSIVPVRRTGDLQRDDAERVFEIYTSLTRSNSLLPPAIGFIFDRETRTEEQRRDIERASRGLVSFLPRRMFENYLLNPAAIAAAINGIGGLDPPGSEECVRQAIDVKLADRQYYLPMRDREALQDPLANVHGARLLCDLFGELSDNQLNFDKIKHSVALTKWIALHRPNDLAEVTAIIAEKLAAPGGRN